MTRFRSCQDNTSCGIIKCAKMMRKYELTLVLVPNISQKNQEKLIEKIKKWAGKGKILSTKIQGKKELAYAIRKGKGEVSLKRKESPEEASLSSSQRPEGIFLFLELEMKPEKGGEIEKRLRLEEEVLRHLLIRV